MFASMHMHMQQKYSMFASTYVHAYAAKMHTTQYVPKYALTPKVHTCGTHTTLAINCLKGEEQHAIGDKTYTYVCT